jgi:uncharacterized protein YuzE
MTRDSIRLRSIVLLVTVSAFLLPPRLASAQPSDRLVLSAQEDANLGGLTFGDDDLADYDPPTDTATRLFDGGNLFSDNGEDIDAVHVLANGHIVLSTEGNARLGGLSFGDDDLVAYDPSTDTTTRLFDGGNLFTNTNEDIDAVHVLANGNIVLSTEGNATLGGLTFGDDDLVEYDPSTDTATLLFDGGNLFSNNGEDIDAVHVLANGNIVLSTEDNANLGGLTFGDDDLVEYDPSTDTATLLFDGGNLFSNTNEDIDAVHVLERTDHFDIAHDGSGNTCGAEDITVTKHDALHGADASYAGTITLATSTAHGDWSLVTGAGVLTNAGNGTATYAFAASDNGQVVLGLRNTFVETLNIDVTDGSASEDPSEDPDLTFTTTGLDTFRDEFNSVSYAGNDGSLTWTGDWVENDDDGTPTGGNVTVSAGELALDDNPNTNGDPSAEREADLSGLTSALFSFDFRTIGFVDTNDSIFVEISANGGANWTVLENITGINDTTGSKSYDISAYISGNTRIRFRVNGLNGSGGTSCCYGAAGEQFLVDNVQIEVPSTGGCGADHFSLSHDGFGINCLTESIDVTPIDSAGSALIGYAETVILDTQTGSGSWTATTGNGTLVDATPNDGLSTYTFSGSETFPVSFALEYREGVATFNIDVFESGDPTLRDDDTEGDITFSPNGFTVTPNPLGNPPGAILPVPAQTAGSPFTLYLTAYGQTPADPECGVIESYEPDKDLKFWSSYDNPASGTIPVTVSGTPIATSEAGAGVQSVTFTQGQASVIAKYKDVGRIGIDMKDDAVADPDLPNGIRGGTNLFVVKPDDFVLSNIQRTSDGFPNQAAADASGLVFMQAGDDFSVTVTALDSEGSTTPNYGQESPPEGVLLTPSLVAAGFTSNPAVQFGTGFVFNNGIGLGDDFSWGEVGVITLAPSVGDGNYLGAGEVTGTSTGNVGRFVPFDFDVAYNTPEFGTACGTFGYLGQSFNYVTAPVLTVSARNKAGGITQNYSDTFWKLSDTSLTFPAGTDKGYESASGTLDTVLIASPLPTIVDLGFDTGANHGTGTLTFNADSGLAFTRAGPVPPFDADISLSLNVIDDDGVSYATNPARFGNASPGTGITFSNGKQQRYGRARVDNAHGSELLDLAVPLTVQYFDSASVFVNNADDICTNVTIAIADVSPGDGLDATTETCIWDSGSPGASGAGCTAGAPGGKQFAEPPAAGNLNLFLKAPGAGNDGSADLTVDAPWWLEYAWAGAGDTDPAARATFGVYQGSPHIIFVREPWN